MPTYEYLCSSCGHRFELVQRMSDPPRKRCPECGKKVDRLIGAGAGLLFKGSGFYITDYRSREYQAQAKAESPGTAVPAPAAKESPKPAPAAPSKASDSASGVKSGDAAK